MAHVAAELRGWLALPTGSAVLDVSAARVRLHDKLARELADQDLQQERRDHVHAAARRLQELFRPVNQALRDLHPRAELDVMDDKLTQNVLKTRRYGSDPDIVWRWQRCSRVVAGDEFRQYVLRTGRTLELDEDGTLLLLALVEVGYERMGGNDFFWQLETRSAPVGTVAAEQMLGEGVTEITVALQDAVAVFVERAPGGAG